MGILVRVIINAVAIWLASVIVDGLDVVGGDDAGARLLVLLAVGALFGVVNAVVKPIVRTLSLPLYILTLGLFTLVVNALMLMLTGWISEQTHYGLRIANFGSAVLGGLIIAVVSLVLSLADPDRRSRRRRRSSNRLSPRKR